MSRSTGITLAAGLTYSAMALALLAGPSGGAGAQEAVQERTVQAPDGTFAAPPEEGVWYEIFVRSFQDSDGDGIGDLAGVTRRLDYLAELGIDGIWLTPIHPAASYHGYDVLDYFAIAPEYGTVAELRTLVYEAHARGIRVILDFVPNHTAREHPWFQAALSGDPAARSRYVWRDDDPGWVGLGGSAWHPAGDEYYLGLFHAGMPDLNYESAWVREEMRRILSFWLELGIDGFRVDAVQHIVEGEDGTIAGTAATLAWLRELQAWLRATAAHAFLLGETYALSAHVVAAYHRDGDLDMSLDYPGWSALLAALSQRSAGPLELALEQDDRLYPAGAARARFSANHDQIRPATTLGLLRRDEARLGLIAELLTTLPGTPLLYYGQEIGLPNGPGQRDEQKRTPLTWDAGPGRGFSEGRPWIAFSTEDDGITVAAQREDPDSLWSRYRQAIALRHASPALTRGSTTVLAPEAHSLLAFTRQVEGERLLVVANFATRPATLRLVERPAEAVATLLGEPVGPGDWEVPGLGMRVVRLDSGGP